MATTSPNATDILGATDISGPLQSAVDAVISFGTDFLAFIVVAALIAAFGLYFGRDRLVTLIAALYAAALLYQAFPYTSYLPADNAYIQIGLYAGLTLAALLAFSGLSSFIAKSGSGLLGTGVLSLTTAGLVLAIAIHVLPVQEVYTLSAPTLALFASEQAFFWWLVAPLAGLFFFGK